MSDLIKELYQEIILDHGQDPRNFGECFLTNHGGFCESSLSSRTAHLFISGIKKFYPLYNFLWISITEETGAPDNNDWYKSCF